jgi:hypothetical protein
MIREFGRVKLAVDEHLDSENVLLPPSWMIAKAEVLEIPVGAWLGLPGDCWGIDLPPMTLYSIGLGESMLLLTHKFDATYWTTKDAAEQSLAYIRVLVAAVGEKK